jgi:hypothetical protein
MALHILRTLQRSCKMKDQKEYEIVWDAKIDESEAPMQVPRCLCELVPGIE